MSDTNYSKLSQEAEKVISRVSKDEVVNLALDLANIDSPTGYEKDVLEFIYSWLEKEGFSPKKVGMLEDRYNVAGRLKGTCPHVSDSKGLSPFSIQVMPGR